MKRTQEGAFEYELDAAARHVFPANGARFEGYPSITAGGTNAYMGRYNHPELAGERQVHQGSTGAQRVHRRLS
jgi:Xaa-Pro aminopeptidase